MRPLLVLVILLLITTPGHGAKKKRRRKKTGTEIPTHGVLSTYTSVALQMGVGPDGKSTNLDVKLPPASKPRTIGSPAQLMSHVKDAWESIVAPHQAGLVDPRAGPASREISAGEAWHHWQASQSGVIDSARFLVAFGVVPSLQQGGGGRLHAAAARGLVDEVRALLDDDSSAVHSTSSDGTTPLIAGVTRPCTSAPPACSPALLTSRFPPLTPLPSSVRRWPRRGSPSAARCGRRSTGLR